MATDPVFRSPHAGPRAGSAADFRDIRNCRRAHSLRLNAAEATREQGRRTITDHRIGLRSVLAHPKAAIEEGAPGVLATVAESTKTVGQVARVRNRVGPGIENRSERLTVSRKNRPRHREGSSPMHPGWDGYQPKARATADSHQRRSGHGLGGNPSPDAATARAVLTVGKDRHLFSPEAPTHGRVAPGDAKDVGRGLGGRSGAA